MKAAVAATVFALALTGIRADDNPAPARPIRDLLTDLKNFKDRENSWEVRAKAADALGELGKKAREESDETKRKARLEKLKKEVGPTLMAALKDPDEDVRQAVAAAVGWIGLDTKEAVTQLVQLLKDTKLDMLDMRETVAIALGQIGRMEWEDHPGIPALLPLLKAKETEVKEAAAEALTELGPLPATATQPLISALKDRDSTLTVRRQVVEALGDIGPDAKAAIPALLAVFQGKENKEHPRLRSQAAESLGLIEARREPVVKALAAVVDNKKEPPMVRHAAADALGTLAAYPPIAVPALVEVLKDKPAKGDKTKAGMRVAAARALGEFFTDRKKMGTHYQAARKALEAITKEPGHPRLTETAKEALKKIK